MKKILLSFVIFLISYLSYSATGANPIGGLAYAEQLKSSTSFVSDIQIEEYSGDIYVTGYFSDTLICELDTLISNGGEDIFMIKYDRDGKIKWAYNFGSATNDEGQVIRYSNGSIYLAGIFTGNVDFNPSINNIDSLSTANPSGDIFTIAFNDHGDSVSFDQKFKIKNTHNSFCEVTNVFYQSPSTDGNLIVLGNFHNNLTFQDTITRTSNGGSDIFKLVLFGSNVSGFSYTDFYSFGSSLHDEINDAYADPYDFDPKVQIVGFFHDTIINGNDSLISNGGKDAFFIDLQSNNSIEYISALVGVINNSVLSNSIIINNNGIRCKCSYNMIL
jgi:hypothetical protein